jgi:hypothetical protein
MFSTGFFSVFGVLFGIWTSCIGWAAQTNQKPGSKDQFVMIWIVGIFWMGDPLPMALVSSSEGLKSSQECQK